MVWSKKFRKSGISFDTDTCFPKFFTLGSKEKRRILPEWTPVIQIQSQLCSQGSNYGSAWHDAAQMKRWVYQSGSSDLVA